jgi:hypothetical protein
MLWKRDEIDENKQYKLALTHSPNGYRDFYLVPTDSHDLPEHCVLVTEPVPTELLLSRNPFAISEAVRLENGQRFSVDAHLVWFTEDEHTAWLRDEEIPWLNGMPPKLAPM